MPHFCGVVGCGHNSMRDKEFRFFRVPAPKDRRGLIVPEKQKRRAQWIQSLHRADLTENKIKNMRICSAHFIKGRPAEDEDTTSPDYVPHLNMGYENQKSNKGDARHLRSIVRKQNLLKVIEKKGEHLGCSGGRAVLEALPEHGTTHNATETALGESLVVEESSAAVGLTGEEQLNIIEYLRKELEKSKVVLNQITYTEAAFEGNDKKTKFYTGLPTFISLVNIFELVESEISFAQSISKFQQFMLTLMHLRLNLMFTDLAYRFNISIQTASRIFYKCLHVLYTCLKMFIIWPERGDLVATMPESFKKHFGNKVTVIIDCFEVRIEKSSNLIAQAATWSNYKHNNTIKILIGICPQGAITFISGAYGGRISDKVLTERCGILDKLLPNDLVLADRGFLIQESVELRLAQVLTPPFLKGRKQLSPFEIESTRKLANVRIHVERVIGVVRRKFRILSTLMPISTIKKKIEYNTQAIDEILTVTCALTNLCPSVVI